MLVLRVVLLVCCLIMIKAYKGNPFRDGDNMPLALMLFYSMVVVTFIESVDDVVRML